MHCNSTRLSITNFGPTAALQHESSQIDGILPGASIHGDTSKQFRELEMDAARPAKLSALQKWTDFHSAVLLILCILLCLLPFSNKAFHIDDPLLVWTAQQIAKHPRSLWVSRRLVRHRNACVGDNPRILPWLPTMERWWAALPVGRNAHFIWAFCCPRSPWCWGHIAWRADLQTSRSSPQRQRC